VGTLTLAAVAGVATQAFAASRGPATRARRGAVVPGAAVRESSTRATGRPAACLAGGAAATLAWLANARRRVGRGEGAGKGRLRGIARSASNEERLLKLVQEFPGDYDPDDMQEVLQACKKMGGVPKDAFQQFVGSWRLDWSSSSGKVWSAAKASTLKQCSFGTLPATSVTILGTYHRVLESGTYETVDAFTAKGADGAEAGVVLAGSWTTGTAEGDWGRGAARTRCGTSFKTVRLAASTEDPGASKAMLEEAGLGGCLGPQDVSRPPTYVDIDYIGGDVCVTKDESGVVNVLTRMPKAVPFDLD